MSCSPSIAIIGAGPIGLLSARALVMRDAQVSLFDQAPGPGQGASQYNSGMIHPSQAWPWGYEGEVEDIADLYALANRSRDIWREILSDLGQTQLATGCYKICRADQIDILGARYDRAQHISGLSYETTTCFDRTAFYFPDDFKVEAWPLLRDIWQYLQSFNLNSHFNAPVEHFTGRTVTVGNDTLEFDAVLVAAGVGSSTLLKPLGLDVPVMAATGYALNFKRPEGDMPLSPVMDYDSRSALTVYADHVRLSGTVDETTPKALLATWRNICPELIERLGDPTLSWVGQRPVAPQRRPIMTETNEPSLFVATGHGHMGLTYAAAVGEVMADMIMAR